MSSGASVARWPAAPCSGAVDWEVAVRGAELGERPVWDAAAGA